jgi:hypothetical protein
MAVALLLGARALASVEDTPHDFRVGHFKGSSTVYTNLRAVAGDEICRPCHVPHNSAKTHLFPDHGEGSYTGVFLEESLLCLGCHDGNIATTKGTDTMNPAYKVSPTSSHDLNQNLKSVLPDVLVNGSTVQSQFNPLTTLPLYSGNGQSGLMACMTCHDPHVWKKDGTGKWFLRSSDAYGDLCVTCHINESGLTP